MGTAPSAATSSGSCTFSPEAATDVALDCESEIRIPSLRRGEPLLVPPSCTPAPAVTRLAKPSLGFAFAHIGAGERSLLITRFNTFACVSGLANTQQQRVQFEGLYPCKAIYQNGPGDVFSGIKSPPSIFFQLTQTLLSQIDVKRLDNAHL